MKPNGEELLRELFLMGLEEEEGEDVEEKRREIENMDEEALLERLVQEERARKEELKKEEIPYTPESFQKWAEERWQGEDDFLKKILEDWQKMDTEEYHKYDDAIDGGLWPPECLALSTKQREDFERWRQEGIPEDERYRRRDWREKGRMIEESVIRKRIRLVREKYGFPPEKKERSGPLAPLRFGNSSGADEKDDE